MTIVEAANKSNEVIEGVERDYRVGFINGEYPNGDETELTATGLEDLKDAWEYICPEFGVEPDSVTYVEGAPFAPWRIEAEFKNGEKDVFPGSTEEECMDDIAAAEKRFGECVWHAGVENELYTGGKYVGTY